MFEPSDLDIDAGPHIEPPLDFGIRRLTQRTFLVELVLAKDLFDQFCALTKKVQRDSHYYLPQGCHADGAVVTDPRSGKHTSSRTEFRLLFLYCPSRCPVLNDRGRDRSVGGRGGGRGLPKCERGLTGGFSTVRSGKPGVCPRSVTAGRPPI
jgi:hypothetical protein